MNIPGITRALELDDADWDLAVKLRGLTEHQREQFSAALGPVKAQKKSSKKSGGKSPTKSTRASGMAAQLNAQLGNRRQESNSSVSKCTHQFDSGAMCFEPADANVHHMPTAHNYHPFQPAEQAAATSGD